jgi:hypothetical protein
MLSLLHPDCYTPGTENTRLGRTHSRSGRSGEEETLLPISDMDPRVPYHSACVPVY